jgi:CRP/FNR family transcriptional regulator, dissimilatory nitrate respiration regulator
LNFIQLKSNKLGANWLDLYMESECGMSSPSGFDSRSEALLVLLRTVPYFQTVNESLLHHLARECIHRQFAAGEVIFLEGENSSGLWIVESGRVKIYKANVEGGEHVMHILGEGNTFNDVAALDAGMNPANAASLSDVSLWLLPSGLLRSAIATNGQLALDVITYLTKRVRGLVTRIEDLALYSVTVRLARFLLHQAEDSALSGPGVTRATIAALLNTTPQTVSTTLRELESIGAIQFNRHEILIVNEPLLRQIALL